MKGSNLSGVGFSRKHVGNSGDMIRNDPHLCPILPCYICPWNQFWELGSAPIRPNQNHPNFAPLQPAGAQSSHRRSGQCSPESQRKATGSLAAAWYWCYSLCLAAKNVQLLGVSIFDVSEPSSIGLSADRAPHSVPWFLVSVSRSKRQLLVSPLFFGSVVNESNHGIQDHPRC